MPFKGSKRHHASHHGNRQNGLAQPGRKIEKLGRQRSNGQLNVSASAAAAAQPHSSSAPRRVPTRHGSLTGSEDAFAEVAQNREKLVAAGDDPETHEDLDDFQGEIQVQNISQSTGLDGQLPRRIDVNTAGNPAVHADRGALLIAITILRACPLADTLAILIILLQIPAAVLTVVNLLYVALTFVPPTTSNIPTLPSFADVHQSSGGTPSFVTVALADVVFFVGWMFLWTPLQELALDLAQAVIAISLGGRLASRHRGSKSALMCLGIVILSHFGRCRCLRLPGSTTFLSVRSPLSIKFTPWWLALRYPTLHPQKGWLHTSLAVHVLAQATIRVVRQWLSRHGKSIFTNTHTKRQPDSSTPSGTYIESSGNRTLTLDTIDYRGISLQPPLPPSNLRPPRDEELFAKKMKRQGMYVRIFQPLWAAVASTKTIVLSQYAYSRINKKATGTATRDAGNLGDASFQSEEGRVWATRITTREIFLETSFFNTVGNDTTESNSEDVPRANELAASARSEPFYVLVNQDEWPSIRISEIEKEQIGNNENIGSWAIEVYGLAPASHYTCTVIRSHNDEVLCSMHLTTQQIPAADSARASSPLTALKKAIAAAEAKLEEEKTSLKKLRKEHKVQTTSLKKEVDASNIRFVHSGSNDVRQRQRLLQIGQHIRQAEDAAAQVSSQTEAMGQVPEHDLSDSRESKETWDTMRRRHSEAQAELNESARKSDRQIAAIQSEASNLQQKRERVQARQSKLKDQYERLGNAKAAVLSGKDLTVTSHTGKDDQRQSAERRFIERSQSLHDHLKEIQLGSQQLWQQVHAIETACMDQQQRANSAPTTPEGNLPGTMMGNRKPPTARFSNFVFPPGLSTQPATSSRSMPGHREGRARSSSMLSNVSGFTDFVDVPAVTADVVINGMNYTSRENTRHDGGFGGGRSRSGSHRDPASPFPKQLSPYAGGKGTSPVWR